MAKREYVGSVVYFVGAYRGLIKIGVAKDIESRLRHLRTGSGVPLTLLATVPGGFALERHYHAMFAGSRRQGEWFARSPELTAEIKRLKAEAKTRAAADAIYEPDEIKALRVKMRDEWEQAVAARAARKTA